MSGLSLQELNYFGTSWYTIERSTDSPAFALSQDFRKVGVERTEDGLFFAGILEKVDAQGRVTDVVLSFSGTQAGATNDIVTNVALLAGVSDPQTVRAAALFDGLMADPRYQEARIHVTGHSLGGVITEHVLGHALVTFGRDVVEARADFTPFGAPPVGDRIAAHYGLSTEAFAGLVEGYYIENDLTQLIGVRHVPLGVQHVLAAYEPYDDLINATAMNGVAAHHPSAYLGGIGLPDWLTTEQRAAAIAAVRADSGSQDFYDPDYGASGPVAQHVIGDSMANNLHGTAGDDVLTGAGGADLLSGGTGADRFVYLQTTDSQPDASDMILDFDGAHGDRIDLSAIDARTDRVGNNAFVFVGDGPITGPGQVAVHVADGISYIHANIGGDLRAELVIAVHSTQPLAPSDFIF